MGGSSDPTAMGGANPAASGSSAGFGTTNLTFLYGSNMGFAFLANFYFFCMQVGLSS